MLGDPQAIDPLFKRLRNSNELPDVITAAASALEKLAPAHDEQVTGWIAALSGGSYKARELAAKALGTLQDPRALEPLEKALKDQNNDVRIAAEIAIRVITISTSLLRPVDPYSALLLRPEIPPQEPDPKKLLRSAS